MADRPSAADLIWTDVGIWVRTIIGVLLLTLAILFMTHGQLFGVVPLAFGALFAFEIARQVALLRILGARGVFADGTLVREDAPEGESDWWSGYYQFEHAGRRYEHRESSFMFRPKSTHGTVVGILFDPLDPQRAVVRGKYDNISAPR